jgi:hypothetical protein
VARMAGPSSSARSRAQLTSHDPDHRWRGHGARQHLGLSDFHALWRELAKQGSDRSPISRSVYSVSTATICAADRVQASAERRLEKATPKIAIRNRSRAPMARRSTATPASSDWKGFDRPPTGGAAQYFARTLGQASWKPVQWNVTWRGRV